MILFGLVSFREKYNESITFIDLKDSYIHSKSPDKRLNVFIFDNTDLGDWNISYNNENVSIEGILLHYHHDIGNPGISYAYNKIAEYAKEKGFSHIVFLDQDTHLPLDFYDQYHNHINNIDIAAPIIMNGDLIFSPSKYKYYRSINLEKINVYQLDLKNHTCINSGLLIRTSLFFKVGGYNNMLRLDFCDHEFIRRVSKVKNTITILPIILKQTFSTEVNTLDKAIFRYKIFLKDLLSLKKIDNSEGKLFFLIDLPHLLRLTLQYRTFKFFKIRIQI